MRQLLCVWLLGTAVTCSAPEDLRKEFNAEWRAVMERLEYDALPHPEALDWPDSGFWDKITRISPIRGSVEPPRTSQPSTLAPHTSRLEVGADAFLPLEATHCAVRIDGFRARVVVDLFYRNDGDKRLAGKLQLRLPDGAVPDYTAFGAARATAMPEAPGTTLTSMRSERAGLKEARMVPRTKAARAYEETVRRRIDPALVEWSGGGIFDVRVFPLEPRRLHRISIAYSVDLEPVGDELEYRLELPREAGDLVVDVRTWLGEHLRLHNPERRSLSMRVPGPAAIRMNGKDPELGDFCACRFKPAVPESAAASCPDAIFLIDTSGSSQPDRWFKLAERILERNRPTLRTFRVAFFDVTTRWWRTEAADNTSANVAALMRVARALTTVGATDLGEALRTVAEVPGHADLFLLSDGHATWGDRTPRHVATGQTLFAYGGGDLRTLARLARESGGAVFPLGDDAATAHAKRPWRIVGFDSPGEDVVLRGCPTRVYPGQVLVAAGRGRLARESKLTLRLRQGERTIAIQVPASDPIDSPLTPGIYGAIAVRQLEERGAPEARAYSLHFRVVGPTCSLLMLDSEEDYERFDIRPEQNAEYIRTNPVSGVTAALPNDRDRLLVFLREFAKSPTAERLVREADARELIVDGGGTAALRRLSMRVEAQPGDAEVARAVGLQALADGHAAAAYHLLRHAAELRPQVAQHFLAMALCLERLDKPTLTRIWYEAALSTGAHRGIVRAHYDAFLRRATADIVITILWSTDGTDIDLRVRDAAGEECGYDHTRTGMGGSITSDVTNGLGPEMFVLPRAKPGEYEAWIVNYAPDSIRAGTRTTVYASVLRSGKGSVVRALTFEPDGRRQTVARFRVEAQR